MHSSEPFSSPIDNKTIAGSTSLSSSILFRLPLYWLRKKLEQAGASKLIITLASGEQITIGTAQNHVAVASVDLKNPMGVLRAAREGIIGLAESYMSGDWSTPDLTAVTDWAMANEKRLDALFKPGWLAARLQRLFHLLHNNSRKGSRKNIAAHYDLGNDFYQHWLDPTMTYSSALFMNDQETLEQGQQNKYQHVLNWLQPEPHHRVLEIGCGWGGFSRALLESSDSLYHGITLSKEQLRYARQEAFEHKHQGASFSLMDYRDINAVYDRIVSIEMIEAVGEENWPTYFKTVHDSLRKGGVAIIQAITIDDQRFDDYRKGADFIQRYIFPGGLLPSHQAMKEQIALAGLTLEDTLAFGKDYARTLHQWMKHFNDRWPDIRQAGFDERFRRMWNFYLAYCEAGFKCESINVRFYKILKV